MGQDFKYFSFCVVLLSTGFFFWSQCVTAASIFEDGTEPPACKKGEIRCKNGTCVILGRSQCDNDLTCLDGEALAEADKCDGKVDCADGSDEIVQRCGHLSCAAGQFRCAYGGCAHRFAKCNGIIDCADSSDESKELCGEMEQSRTKPEEDTEQRSGPLCHQILPPQPADGHYVRFVDPKTNPDDGRDVIVLQFSCNKPYALIGKKFVICSGGVWRQDFPSCQGTCKLPRSLRTYYRCPVSGDSTIEGYQECDWRVPLETKVEPVCRSGFFSPEELKPMYCRGRKWNYIPECIPECGRMNPTATLLMSGGRPARWGELPWQVAVYTKKEVPYQQICGGSIISRKVVVSAAHCFWEANELQLPCNYAVAAGKLYRDWEDEREENVQRRDVIDIKVPPRFRGIQASFQDDIALMILSGALNYETFVKPVCTDFTHTFDSRQLQEGSKGKVAGWGYTSEEGVPSPFLKVAELPIVAIEECYKETPSGFTPYITTDKICAGYKNGTATVCKGDSGGGLAFPEESNGETRHYLRGIVSTAPADGLKCNTKTITAFTHVISHRDFIKSHFVNFTVSGFQFVDYGKVTRYEETDCL